MENSSFQLQAKGKSRNVIQLRFNETKTEVSKLFLAAASEYFRALFQHDSDCQEICLETIVPGEAATALSTWLSPHGARLVPREEVPDLFGAAHYLCMEELRQHSRDAIEAATDIENCSIAIRLSHFYSDLEIFANRFVESNFVSLYRGACEAWDDAPPETFLRLLDQPNLAVPCEDFVWEAIWTWAKREFEARKQHVPTLLRSTMRMGLVRRSTFLRMLDHCRSSLQLSAEDRATLAQVEAFQDWKQSTSLFAAMPQVPSAMMMPRLPASCAIASGGISNSVASSRMELYDHDHDVWYELDLCLPLPNVYHGTAVLSRNLYALGGWDEMDHLRSAHALDLDTLSWRQLPPMHYRRKFIMVAALDGCVYAIGGNDGTSGNRRHRSCERFNPVTNQWEMVASMNCQRSDGDALAHEGQIWVVGGFTALDYMKSVETYDVKENKWAERPSLKVARGGVKCVVFSNKLYAIGGFDGTTRLRSVECLDLDDIGAGWTIDSHMHRGRSNFGACVVAGKIFVVGGYIHPEYTNEVEWFDGLVWHKAECFLRTVSAPCMVLVEQTNALKSRLKQSDLKDFIKTKRRRRIEAVKNALTSPETLAVLDVHTFDSRFVGSHPEENYLRSWSKCIRLTSQLIRDAKRLA